MMLMRERLGVADTRQNRNLYVPHALRRLAAATPRELLDRTRQRAAVYLERLGLSSLLREPTDAEVAGQCQELLSIDGSRRFFASFEDRAATIDALRETWPEAEQAVIEEADRICAGRFALLGHLDLAFGSPIDWHRDPLLGVRSPLVHWSRIDYLDPDVAGDHKLVWELNRHQYFLTLGQAYWYTGDERYAEVFSRHLLDWLRANPPGRGINWASSLELAFRAISWAWALHFFRGSPSMSEQLVRRALRSLVVHARHIETHLSTHFSPNTHLTGEALGLLYLGTCLPALPGAARWRRIGREILAAQIERQIHADGVYFEQATYYQRYTADFYLHAHILGARNGEPLAPETTRPLLALIDCLMHLTRPDGLTPLLGDDDGGRLLPIDGRVPADCRAVLATASVLFDRPDYRYVAGRPSPELLWLLGAEALAQYGRMEARPPSRMSCSFPKGGYFIMRERWRSDADHLIIDCGPHGTGNGGHAHADALAIELSVDGRPVFVDSGTFTYTTSRAERDAFRGTRAHNTVTVDDESSSSPAGPFKWDEKAQATPRQWISTDRFDYFEGSHDGYARLADPAIHARSVLWLKGQYWIIRDRVTSTGSHQVGIHFHLTPDVHAILDDTSSFTVRDVATGAAVLQTSCFGSGGNWVVTDGFVSACYGARQRADVCRLLGTARGIYEVFTLMIPVRSGSHRVREIGAPCGAARAFTVTGPRAEDLIALTARGQVSPLVDVDADWAWIRHSRDAKRVEEFVLVGARRAELTGEITVETVRPVEFIAGRRVGPGWRVTSDAPAALAIVDRCGEPIQNLPLPGGRGSSEGELFWSDSRAPHAFMRGES